MVSTHMHLRNILDLIRTEYCSRTGIYLYTSEHILTLNKLLSVFLADFTTLTPRNTKLMIVWRISRYDPSVLLFLSLFLPFSATPVPIFLAGLALDTLFISETERIRYPPLIRWSEIISAPIRFEHRDNEAPLNLNNT